MPRLFADVDLVLVPAMYLASPTFERMSKLSDPEELAMLLRFTAPFDVSGSPTITLPCGFTAGGLPVAFQLVGPHLSEAPAAARRPRLPAGDRLAHHAPGALIAHGRPGRCLRLKRAGARARPGSDRP